MSTRAVGLYGTGFLLVLALLIVALALGFRHDPNSITSPLVTKPAPSFALRLLDGKGTVSLAALRGRPVIVNFWASWCVACVDEHNYLRAAWQTYGDQVAFVGIDYQDSAADAQKFMKDHGGGWPVVQDPGQGTAIGFGVYGVPETYFIDRQGVIS